MKRVVVVTGAAGAAGTAVSRALVAAGARVVGVGRDAARLAEVEASLGSLGDGAGSFEPQVLDLLDEAATASWARDLEQRTGSIDGVVHLVGGWRGGKGFLDVTTADAAWLHDSLVRTLQHVTLACHDPLLRSGNGRFAIVSATAVDAPSAGGAAYASAKAAAEAWTLALADSFARKGSSTPASAAAVVLVVKALLTPQMRAARPEAAFSGFTPVESLADAVAGLWSSPASDVNGTRIDLVPRTKEVPL